MKNFYQFINEEYEEQETDPVFEIGDEVYVNGKVGLREFFNDEGTILKKKKVYYINPRPSRFGVPDNSYYGNVYYIDSIKYWVPPYVLKKIDNITKPKIRWYKNGKFQN